MTNCGVVKAFYNDEKSIESSTGNLWINQFGDKLYSYETCIAQKTDSGIIKNITHYSSSTSKHQGLIDKFTFYATNVPRNCKDLIKYIVK